MKLIDFGLAKGLGDVSARTTTLVGTPHFMAPEVLRGNGYGLAADMWSLGVCMYELVVGELPFGHGEDDDQYSLFRAILFRQPEIPPEIDDDAADLVQRWLRKDDEERWEDNSTESQKHSF